MTRARAARGRAAPSGKPSRNVASVLGRLTPWEAATVLHRFLAAHPDLRADVGKIASDLLGEVSFEDVACEIEEAVRALDLDDLNSRAGSHSSGYKEPTDAAWELLEEVVEPFLEDMKRQAELYSAANALEICKGVILGLYRVRHEPNGGTVLGWAPDFAPETAMWAVEMWSTGGGGTWKGRRAPRDPAVLPEGFVETHVPEWRALIAQTLSRLQSPRCAPKQEAGAMKPNRWITDLRHLMRPDGTLVSDRSTSLPVYLSMLVEAATASPADAWVVSPVRCRLRPAHKRCPGHTHVYRAKSSDTIEWACPVCRASGTITGWQATPWDLRGRPDAGTRADLRSRRPAVRRRSSVQISDRRTAADSQ